MSLIVGLDGKTPIQSEAEQTEYRAGGLQFKTTLSPNALLTKALQGAQQGIGNQIYSQEMQSSRSALTAQAKAQAAVAGIVDPFTIEPAAMAVFMYMAREVEYRDGIIAQLNDRLVKLGAEPLDLTHPYPLPSKDEEAEEDEEAGSDGDGEPSDGDGELTN